MMLTQEQPAIARATPRASAWKRRLWMIRQSPLTVVGGAIIVLMLLLMIFAPWLVPQHPNAINLSERLLPPGAGPRFGAESVGRALFSRGLIGSPQSVAAGLALVLGSGISGSLLASRSATR